MTTASHPEMLAIARRATALTFKAVLDDTPPPPCPYPLTSGRGRKWTCAANLARLEAERIARVLRGVPIQITIME